ncbi:RrF2 family transcriptional regulator [Clostridium aminobutyricum]|uniref:Rrf2 family transcriptional regulator n=1 Tax=Clostridium aminobutyricum TaxID=33953 RepID=A0A939D7V6_CLOAM|nr:Rrf2 family transcriptional regulator [Clostridium aminobutyricum]MBN7772702.1 Rrf2 family transcriptional regulator [Clostridium aminobutyricum]
MKVSTKGRYSLRLLIDLAEHNTGEYIPLKEISERQNISVKYLEQIVNQLGKAGYLNSVRGPQGGYKLSKAPKEYIIGDILRIMEGSFAPISCLQDTKNQCERYNECATISFWEGLYEVIDDYINQFTLQDLVDKHTEKRKWDYTI